MLLHQNQLWKQGDRYIRLVHIERLHVEYKTMTDLVMREGTRSRCTKKEFCRLIKNATLVAISTRVDRDEPPAASPAHSEQTPAASPGGFFFLWRDELAQKERPQRPWASSGKAAPAFREDNQLD